MKEQWVICHYFSHEMELHGMFDSEKDAIEYAAGICAAVGALDGTYSVHKVRDVKEVLEELT